MSSSRRAAGCPRKISKSVDGSSRRAKSRTADVSVAPGITPGVFICRPATIVEIDQPDVAQSDENACMTADGAPRRDVRANPVRRGGRQRDGCEPSVAASQSDSTAASSPPPRFRPAPAPGCRRWKVDRHLSSLGAIRSCYESAADLMPGLRGFENSRAPSHNPGLTSTSLTADAPATTHRPSSIRMRPSATSSRAIG